jgi:hypothetical protein
MLFLGNKSVKSRIDEAVKIIEKMATGGFTGHIDTSGNDVVAPLRRALKDNMIMQERRSSEGRRDSDTSAAQSAFFNKEFSNVIEGIQNGKLSMRMTLENLPDGSYRYIAGGVNLILDALTGPLFKLADYLHDLSEGNFPPKIADNYKGDFSTIKDTLNATNDILTGLMASRVALDNVTTNVMIADNERNIIYINKSIEEMLARAEYDVRKVLPTFNASKLVGTNIDQFHKNPVHQKALLAGFTSTHRTEIRVGPRVFALVANPVISARGKRLGSVVEWKDRTDEVAVEQEISNLVANAGQGDFSKLCARFGTDSADIQRRAHPGSYRCRGRLPGSSRGELRKNLSAGSGISRPYLYDYCGYTA